MLRVVALLPDPRAQKRLAAALALRDRAWKPVVELAGGWSHAHALALSSVAELVVFDPYAGGSFDAEPMRCFAARFPSCVLVGYGAFPRGCARDVLELSRAGVHAVATRDLDDAPHALADVLERALESAIIVRAEALLEQQVPHPVRALLPHVLFRTGDELTPPGVARLCHCHPKTLRAHLRAAGLPSLGKLIVWTRLIRACHLLQDGGRSVESVALVLGFASANSFRNQLLRYVGVCPTELRRRENAGLVLDRFQAAMKKREVAKRFASV